MIIVRRANPDGKETSPLGFRTEYRKCHARTQLVERLKIIAYSSVRMRRAYFCFVFKVNKDNNNVITPKKLRNFTMTQQDDARNL